MTLPAPLMGRLPTRPVDLKDLLAETFEMAQGIDGSPWPLPVVHGDHDLIVLALHNLLDNAVKFTNPGDTVELRAFEDGDSVVIEVADTGPGIPQDEVQHISGRSSTEGRTSAAYPAAGWAWRWCDRRPA